MLVMDYTVLSLETPLSTSSPESGCKLRKSIQRLRTVLQPSHERSVPLAAKPLQYPDGLESTDLAEAVRNTHRSTHAQLW